MWYINYNLNYGFEQMKVEFEPTAEELQQYYGFVYVIIEKSTGKKYIGKKFFWNQKILPKTKTRKRRQRILVESDWKSYYGSSKEVQSIVEQNGESNYTRIIIKLCNSKGECSYWEAKYQFQYDVLLREDFYNELISCRIHARHVKGLHNANH